jgi:hypothetical protein
MLLSSMTHCLSVYFHITCHFPTFAHFCLMMEAVYFIEILVLAYQTVQYHDPKDHNMYLYEIVLEPTPVPHQIPANRVPSLWLGPKTSAFQILSCQILGKIFHRECWNIGHGTWFIHPPVVAELLWIYWDAQWIWVIVELNSQAWWSVRK